MALRIVSFVSLFCLLFFIFGEAPLATTNENLLTNRCEMWTNSAWSIRVIVITIFVCGLCATITGFKAEPISLWVSATGALLWVAYWQLDWPATDFHCTTKTQIVVLAVSQVLAFSVHIFKGWRGFMLMPYG